jgi:hypothetical protein
MIVQCGKNWIVLDSKGMIQLRTVNKRIAEWFVLHN